MDVIAIDSVVLLGFIDFGGGAGTEGADVDKGARSKPPAGVGGTTERSFCGDDLAAGPLVLAAVAGRGGVDTTTAAVAAGFVGFGSRGGGGALAGCETISTIAASSRVSRSTDGGGSSFEKRYSKSYLRFAASCTFPF